MKTILITPDLRRLRQERRKAATAALVAPIVPLAFLANIFQMVDPMASLLKGEFGGAVAFGCGIAVGGSVVLALMSGRRFMRSGGSRVRGALLAAAAPTLALVALLAGRLPLP